MTRDMPLTRARFNQHLAGSLKRLLHQACIKLCSGTWTTKCGVNIYNKTGTNANGWEYYNYERDNSCGRTRNQVISRHPRRFKAAPAGLRQTDDLLSPVDAHARGHKGYTSNHHAP